MAKRRLGKEEPPPGPLNDPETAQAPIDICSESIDETRRRIRLQRVKSSLARRVMSSLARQVMQAGPRKSGIPQSALKQLKRQQKRQRKQACQPCLDQNHPRVPRKVGAGRKDPMVVDATATETSNLSPLLQLSHETTGKILRYLLVAYGGRICPHTRAPLSLVNKGCRTPIPYPYSGVHPEILRVARRFYRQGLVILYSENVFYFQHTFSAGGTGLLAIENYLAKMSAAGRSMIKTVGFSVDLLSINLAPQVWAPRPGNDALSCLRDVEAACQYLNDSLSSLEYLSVFLWESYDLAEAVVATGGGSHESHDFEQRLLDSGIKLLFLVLAQSRGGTIVTVQGEMLWFAIAEVFQDPSDWLERGMPSSYGIRTGGKSFLLVKGCLCPFWREADGLTAWMASAMLRLRERLRNIRTGIIRTRGGATAPANSLFPRILSLLGPRLVKWLDKPTR
ncbi:MAG: hypothetical protein LQ347_003426 [Umbilicaria vellea]|nr:MAG: hypothetical protein LQ347_003426 [Umbilicaria vellea]